MKGRKAVRKAKAAARAALVEKGCLCQSCPHKVPPCCTWEVDLWPSEAADICDGYPGVVRDVREELLRRVNADETWQGTKNHCPFQDLRTGKCRVYNDAPWICACFGLNGDGHSEGVCRVDWIPDFDKFRIDDSATLKTWDSPGGQEKTRSQTLPRVKNNGKRTKYLPEGMVLELIRRGDTELAMAERRAQKRDKKRAKQRATAMRTA